MRTAILFTYEAEKAAAEAGPEDRVTSNLTLATRLAQWYYKRVPPVLPLDDLQSVAFLALIDADKAYGDRDPADFPKYAKEVIIRRMRSALADEHGMGIDSNKWGDVKRLKEFDRELTDGELCERLGWGPDRLCTTRQALTAIWQHKSLDAPLDEDDESHTLGNVIADTRPGPAEAALKKVWATQEREWLVKALEDLPPFARNVISLRFGIPVPGTKTLPLRDVIRAGASMRAGTWRGMQRLKEARRNERGDMPAVVSDNPKTISDGHRADTAFTAAEGKRRAADIWRLYKSGPDAPPALQSTRTVGN